MPWPFSNVGPPTFAVNTESMPTALTSVTTSTVYLLGLHFTNSNSVPATVTVISADGTNVVAVQMEIPAKGAAPSGAFNFNFKPMGGVQWQASAPGVSGSIWGY